MPAQGGGRGGVRERVVLPPRPAPAPYHPPLVYAPPRPAAPLRNSPFHERSPFHQALHEAAQRVQHAHVQVIHQWTPEARRQEAEDQRPHTTPLLAAGERSGLQQLRQESARALAPILREQARKRAEGASPLNLGFVNLTPAVSALAHAKVPGLGGIPGKLINEAIDLPAQTFLSGAVAGSAARQAIEGKPTAGSALLQSVLSQVEHPLRSAEEAPLSTALMFAGGENALGRLGGRVARTGALGDRAAELAATARPDLKLYGDEAVTGRKYNADPLRKAGQVAYEKALPKLPGDLAQPDAFQASGWRLRRNLTGGVTKVGRVDRIAAGSEATRRAFVRSGITPKIEAAKPAVGEHVVPLVVQRIVRSPATWEGDLQKEIGKLKAAQPGLKGSDLKANRANLEHAEEGLKLPAEQRQQVFDAGQRIVDLQGPLTADKVRSGALREEQLRAGLFPYAQAHMGGRYFTEADHVAAESAAARLEQEAQARVAQLEPGSAEAAHARREVLAARAYRHEVSGRGAPEWQAAHERAVEAHQGALAGQDRAAGLQAIREAPQPPIQPGLRTAEGKHLPNEAILEHMAANGVDPPGFVSHKTGAAGRGSFFKSSLRQPTLERFARTGASFAKGTADHSWEALAGTTARLASDAAQAEVRARSLNRLGIGQYDSAEAAHAAADRFHATATGESSGLPLGKVQVVHMGSGQIIEKGHVAPTADAQQVLRQFGLEHHESPVSAHLGKYTLIPEQVQKRLAEHEGALRSDGNLGRALQVYQQGFRKAKLNTSMPHIFGVAQEQAIRLGAEMAGPRAAQAGAKFTRNLNQLAELDKHGAVADSHGPLGAHFRELEGALANRGGLAGSQRATDVTRLKGDQFQQTSALGYIAHGAEGAVKSKAGAAIGVPWRAWKTLIEGGLGKVEHGTRSALLGKALRDSGIIDSYRQVIGMQDEAVKALIAGKLTPNMADHLAEAIDDMGGNWNRQTPAVRKAIGKYAPFGLWWLNSMRWLYRLPVTHPIKTGILAGLYQATREQRNAKGQGFDAAHPVPNFLQGTIDTKLPIVGNVKVAPSYYSPGGTLGPEMGNTAAEQFVPQLQGIYAAARNQNPLTGQPLRTAKGGELNAPQNLLNVLGETLSGPTPFATQAQKLLTMGGKPYGTSNLLTDALGRLGGPPQVKPGTERSLPSVLVKLLSPARFDYPSKAKGATGSLPSTPEAAFKRAIEQQSRATSSPALEGAWKRALSR